MPKKKTKKKAPRAYQKWTEKRKHQILNKYAKTKYGQKQAYLDSLGIHSSHIYAWREALG